MLENGCKITKVYEYEISEEFDEFLLVNAKLKSIHSLMHYDNGITVKNPGKGFFLSDHINACKDWNVIEVHNPNFPCLKVNYEELFAIGYSIKYLVNSTAEFIEGLEHKEDLYDYLVSEKHSNNEHDGIFYPLDIEKLKMMSKGNL